MHCLGGQAMMGGKMTTRMWYCLGRNFLPKQLTSTSKNESRIAKLSPWTWSHLCLPRERPWIDQIMASQKTGQKMKGSFYTKTRFTYPPMKISAEKSPKCITSQSTYGSPRNPEDQGLGKMGILLGTNGQVHYPVCASLCGL